MERRFSDEKLIAERWLREEVSSAYDQMKANPASAIPLKDVIESIRARHTARLKDAK